MSADQTNQMFDYIPPGWGCLKLVDCTIDGNISYGIVQPGQHVENGIPIIRVNNVNNGQLLLNDVLKVAPTIEQKYSRTRLVGGEVLLTLVGSTGQSFVAPKELTGWNVPRAIAVIRPRSDIGAEWINICLQSKPIQYFLDVRANTTVQKTLNLKDVRDIPIPIPPEPIKERIEAIAITLQNKIELNRQINQTLEELAQTIFKSWFVDFEPVKAKIEAKANGQDPERAAMCAISGAVQGCTNVAGARKAGATKTVDELDHLPPDKLSQLRTTAALFPDELVESELGPIPKGWDIGDLNNFCEMNKKSWTKKNTPDQVWYVDLANTKNGHINEVQHFKWEEAPSRARRILNYGDTIIGTVRPGNCSFALIGKTEIVLTGSTGFAVLSPKENYYREITYLIGAGRTNIERLSHLADGAAYPAVRPDAVTAIECTIPCKEIVKHFSRIVGAMFDNIDCNNNEQFMLTQVRDTLLPKLLSGEIEIN